MAERDGEELDAPEWHVDAMQTLGAAFPGSTWARDGVMLEGTLPLAVPVVEDGKVYTCIMAHVEDEEDGWFRAILYAGKSTVPGSIPALDNPEGMAPNSPIRAVQQALRNLRLNGATGTQLVACAVRT